MKYLRNYNNGFTFIELLVVIAVLGVVFGMLTRIVSSSLDKNHLKAAAISIASELNKARSTALKDNQQVSLTFQKNGDSFTVTSNGQQISKALPRGTTIANISNNLTELTVSYTPPYGEIVDNLPRQITVDDSKNSTNPIFIRLIGITGKVIVRETP